MTPISHPSATGSTGSTNIPKLTEVKPVLGRALMATIFLVSGFGKLAAHDATLGYIQSVGLPMPQGAYALAVLVEIGGGLLLLVGYRTRLTALVLAAFSVATAVGFHAQFGDQNQTIHFLKNLAIAGGLLQVAAFGAGAFGLDTRRRF